jgi:hypothetical protein
LIFFYLEVGWKWMSPDNNLLLDLDDSQFMKPPISPDDGEDEGDDA